MSKPMELGALKVGSSIIIDGEPCRIVNYIKSKPGKHGSAKARIVAIGIFDESKRTLVKPISAQVEVPMIEKKSGQVISILSNSVQIMDLETYEIFEAPLLEEEKKFDYTPGVEVEYWRILGKTKIVRKKG